MTTVIIESGACGFTVKVTAVKGKDRTIAVTLDTTCEMVRNMSPDIATVDRMAALVGFRDNLVYQSAAKHLRHVACPVPSGILKAIETEAGMNVAKDARIRFTQEP